MKLINSKLTRVIIIYAKRSERWSNLEGKRGRSGRLDSRSVLFNKANQLKQGKNKYIIIKDHFSITFYN